MHYSFYVNTIMIDHPTGRPSIYGAGAPWENPVYVKRAWREALEHGHEIGDHTHSHPHAAHYDVGQWEAEMRRCVQILGLPVDADETPERPDPGSGIGVRSEEILGFRAPYLESNDNALKAAQRLGFRYDCSREEGPVTRDRRQFAWPRTLDTVGAVGADSLAEPHPGLWEIPVYSFIAPPDRECEHYGIPPGFRSRLKRVQDYFDVEKGEITGMDWNLWIEYSMTPAEFLATLRYTLDLHLQGNHCPMTVGLHPHLYSEHYSHEAFRCSASERRVALDRFLEDTLTHPQVRVVSHRELLEWMTHPQALR